MNTSKLFTFIILLILFVALLLFYKSAQKTQVVQDQYNQTYNEENNSMEYTDDSGK